MEAAEDKTPAEANAGKETPEGGVLAGGPTGVAASDQERRAAARLVEELEGKGRSARIQEVRIPASESASIVFHSLITIAASLIGLKWPGIGAFICLIGAFSFYAERGLGLRLLGRLIPGRRTSNVLSPPPGPAWEEVEVIFATGYDVPDSYPVGEWLSRRFSGRLTGDRILFYGGMIGTFAALMLRVVGFEDLSLNLFQTLAAAIPLAMIAAQVDRRLAGTPVATQDDLATAREVMTAAREADDGADSGSGIGICLFGAERSSADGAAAFLGDRRLRFKEGCAVINLVRGARGSSPEVTAREGNLMTTRMSPELTDDSPLKPVRVALLSQTAATVARRRGLRAATVVGRGEAGIDLLLDAADGALPNDEEKS